jgi:hypothetical protein
MFVGHLLRGMMQAEHMLSAAQNRKTPVTR